MQGDGLPGEYRRIEYIESSGTQYIKTGIAPFTAIGFECTYLAKSNLSTGTYGAIFGGRLVSKNNDFQLTTYTPSSDYSGDMRYGSNDNNALLLKNVKQTAKLINYVYTAPDNTAITLPDYEWDISSALSYKQIYLFGLNNGGMFTQSGKGCRIYSIKFYNGETIIANFIPCVRKSDNKPGMYDTVTKTFFTNAGTGEFIVPQ